MKYCIRYTMQIKGFCLFCKITFIVQLLMLQQLFLLSCHRSFSENTYITNNMEIILWEVHGASLRVINKGQTNPISLTTIFLMTLLANRSANHQAEFSPSLTFNVFHLNPMVSFTVIQQNGPITIDCQYWFEEKISKYDSLEQYFPFFLLLTAEKIPRQLQHR